MEEKFLMIKKLQNLGFKNVEAGEFYYYFDNFHHLKLHLMILH